PLINEKAQLLLDFFDRLESTLRVLFFCGLGNDVFSHAGRPAQGAGDTAEPSAASFHVGSLPAGASLFWMAWCFLKSTWEMPSKNMANFKRQGWIGPWRFPLSSKSFGTFVPSRCMRCL
ncbi:MAG: hypothetical protein ACLUGG_12320, partial [Oscillospiraceae bacterium]